MRDKGISVYNDLIKNPRMYSNLHTLPSFTFDYGPRVDFASKKEHEVCIVDIRDKNTGYSYYNTTLSSGTFAAGSRRWLSPIIVDCRSREGDLLVSIDLEEEIKGKKVCLSFDTFSLADTLAWMPAADDFQRKTGCDVYVTTFWNHVFNGAYDNLRFSSPGTRERNTFGVIGIGIYDEINLDHHKENPRKIPFQKIAYNHLNLSYHEEKLPKINIMERENKEPKYVCISTESNNENNLWRYAGGWKEVADYLNELGYNVVAVQGYNPNLPNVTPIVHQSLTDKIYTIANCEFFVGTISDYSWISWACEKHVITIGGATEDYYEFQSKNHRVANRTVCNGCINNTKYDIKAMCPEKSGTPSAFECSVNISPEDVKNQIGALLSDI